MSATTKASPRRAPTPAAIVQDQCVCYACQEVIDIEPIRLACSHTYCEECLTHCFRAGLSSIIDFPPNCCGQELCIHQYKHLLPPDTIKKYLELLEQSLWSKDIFCAGQNCRRQRIKSYYIKDKWGLCPKCLEYTCTQCHQLQSKHESTDEELKSKHELSAHPRKCPPNEDAEFFKLAQDRNWRMCPHCNAMVSRSEGCNDMCCRCGRKFCYMCGTTYEGRRTCSCPMTFEPHLHGSHVPRDEQGLMDGARRLVARLRQWEPNPRMAGMIDPNVAIDVRRATPELTLLRARGEYLSTLAYKRVKIKPVPINI